MRCSPLWGLLKGSLNFLPPLLKLVKIFFLSRYIISYFFSVDLTEFYFTLSTSILAYVRAHVLMQFFTFVFRMASIIMSTASCPTSDDSEKFILHTPTEAHLLPLKSLLSTETRRLELTQ